MQDFARLAAAFQYPTPDRLAELEQAAAGMESGSTKRQFRAFVGELEGLSLAEWEELHTRSLDLSPLFVPYVGWVTWGENYQRGEFMAEMKAALEFQGVPMNGELPDHLDPVLRYLAVADPPLPSLVEVFPAAVATLTKKLKETDNSSPYLYLLKAIGSAAESLKTPVGGAR
jgi:nitrate reductase delta subunit